MATQVVEMSAICLTWNDETEEYVVVPCCIFEHQIELDNQLNTNLIEVKR